MAAKYGCSERRVGYRENTGFREHGQGIVTYEQNKLGLSAYYDKRCLKEFVLVFSVINAFKVEKREQSRQFRHAY